MGADGRDEIKSSVLFALHALGGRNGCSRPCAGRISTTVRAHYFNIDVDFPTAPIDVRYVWVAIVRVNVHVLFGRSREIAMFHDGRG